MQLAEDPSVGNRTGEELGADVAGAVGGDLGRLRHLECVPGDLRRGSRRFVDASADLARGGGLLLDRESDAGLDLRDAIDHGGDLAYGIDRLVLFIQHKSFPYVTHGN